MKTKIKFKSSKLNELQADRESPTLSMFEKYSDNRYYGDSNEELILEGYIEAINEDIVYITGIPGSSFKVLVFCTPDKCHEAKDAEADYYGLDEYIDKIKSGWRDVDIIVAMPSVMKTVASIEQILEPMGLMPSSKKGTVTMEIEKTVTQLKASRKHKTIQKFSFENFKKYYEII